MGSKPFYAFNGNRTLPLPLGCKRASRSTLSFPQKRKMPSNIVIALNCKTCRAPQHFWLQNCRLKPQGRKRRPRSHRKALKQPFSNRLQNAQQAERQPKNPNSLSGYYLLRKTSPTRKQRCPGPCFPKSSPTLCPHRYPTIAGSCTGIPPFSAATARLPDAEVPGGGVGDHISTIRSWRSHPRKPL